MSIIIDDALLQAARINRSDVLRELAVSLYVQEKLTLGQASTLAEMPQFEFQVLVGSRGIPPHYDLQDFQEDVAVLRERGIA